MKGIYLNDIPISLFMEYFNKTNLKRREFTPKYADDPTIYTYEFTADGDTYFYRSPFAFNDILGDIQNYYGVTSITVPAESTTSSIDKIYYNPILQVIYPYKYRLKDVNSAWEHFIEFDASTVIDLKDNYLIYPSVVISYNEDYKRWNVYDSNNNLVAYIYENAEFKIPYFDETLGKYIYIDEYQRETSESGIDSTFEKYNKTIRNTLNNIQDIESIVPQAFLTECIGMIDQGYNKKLVYYEKYKKTTTYSIPASVNIVDINLKEYINRETLAELNTTGSDIVQEEYTYPMATVLDFTTVPEIMVEETSTEHIYRKLKSNIPYYGIKKPVILKVYKNFVNFLGRDREFNDNKIIWSSSKSTYAELYGTDRLKIALTTDNTFFYYGSKNNSLTVFINNGTDRYVTIGNVKYPVDSTEEANFPHGSFLYPYSRVNVLSSTLFGSIVDESEYEITLGKYNITSFIDNREPLQNIPDTTETILIQDMYDSSLFIEKIEEYEKIEPSDSYSLTEFIDHYHNKSGSSITLPSEGSMSIAASIESYLTLDNFIKNFNRFEHYITDGFTPNNLSSFRGNLVPEGIFREWRLNTIKDMMSTYMEKRYDNFLFDNANNIFEDDMLMKMRIFAEGYRKLINADRNLSNLNLAKKAVIPHTDISKNILISRDEKSSNYLRKIGENNNTVYLRKEFSSDPTYISKKLSEENAFTKMIDYKRFPTDTLRKKYLREQSARLEAYKDFTKSTRVLDDNRVVERVYKKNTPSLLDYKKFIVYNLIENFYDSNIYVSGNKYLENYELYIKEKLSNDSLYNLKITEETEKEIYLKDYLIENELLEKILVEDWKVL